MHKFYGRSLLEPKFSMSIVLFSIVSLETLLWARLLASDVSLREQEEWPRAAASKQFVTIVSY